MKLLTIIGTRPEAIKMSPILCAAKRRPGVTSLLATTGQHPDLVHAPLHFFGVTADHALQLGDLEQDPLAFVQRATPQLAALIETVRPDRVIVQGDTASAMAGAEAARHCAIPLAHVEAGLRTHSAQPWPEEAFRRSIDGMADLLLAPTALAAQNLREEHLTGVICVTGNSGVDALHTVIDRLAHDEPLRRECAAILPRKRPFILATLHRRENIGQRAEALCLALRRIAATADLVLPLHPNPRLSEPIRQALEGQPGIHLLDPQDPPSIVTLMQHCCLIMTDSGGIQEEAPSFGKLVLILRDVTERPEGIAAGIARLVPVETEAIVQAAWTAIATRGPKRPAANPYGDGRAAERIVAALLGEPFVPFAAQAHSVIAAPSVSN